MSIRIMAAVWDAQRYEAGTLLVLLAMADYANDEDHTCHPSIGRLAQKSRLSERQVSRILVRLKDDGVISPVGEKPTTQGRPIVVYRINTDALSKGDISAAKGDTMSPLEMAKGDIGAAKGDIGDTLNMTPMSYDPSEEPSIEPSVEEGAGTAQPAAAEPPAWYEAEPPTPSTPSTTSTVRSLSQQPPIAIYRDIVERYPSKPQMRLIMTHGVDDLRRWRAILAHWIGRGWSPTNIAGMLDLYDHPERLEERQRPPAPRPSPLAPAPTPGADPVWQQSWDEWIAELSRPAGLGD